MDKIKNEIKVGDKVRILNFPTGAFIGEIGTVYRIVTKLECPIGVDLRPKYIAHPHFYASELEVVG
jgi:hypothetical protein